MLSSCPRAAHPLRILTVREKKDKREQRWKGREAVRRLPGRPP